MELENIVKKQSTTSTFMQAKLLEKNDVLLDVRVLETKTHRFFIHGNIQISKNNMSSLEHEDGSIAKEHLLWNTFRSRLRVSVLIDYSFNYTQFFPHIEGLEELSLPFTHEEIDQVVDHMPGARCFFRSLSERLLACCEV
jgi:hypothetical protein